MVISSDQAGIGYSSTGSSYGGQRPDLRTGERGCSGAGAARTQVFNPLAFALPAAGKFGNLGAYALWYPLYCELGCFDLRRHSRSAKRSRQASGLSCTTSRITSRTPPFSNVLGSSNFGQATAATDPRTLQLALKVSF